MPLPNRNSTSTNERPAHSARRAASKTLASTDERRLRATIERRRRQRPVSQALSLSLSLARARIHSPNMLSRIVPRRVPASTASLRQCSRPSAASSSSTSRTSWSSRGPAQRRWNTPAPRPGEGPLMSRRADRELPGAFYLLASPPLLPSLTPSSRRALRRQGRAAPTCGGSIAMKTPPADLMGEKTSSRPASGGRAPSRSSSPSSPSRASPSSTTKRRRRPSSRRRCTPYAPRPAPAPSSATTSTSSSPSPGSAAR